MIFKISLIFLVIVRGESFGKLSTQDKTSKKYNFVITSGNSVERDLLPDSGDKTLLKEGNYHHVSLVAGIPPAKDGAKVARYIVRKSVWGSLASISTLSDIKGFPFTDIYSVSDGPVGNSTGVPYFYVTPLDITAKNLKRDSRCSLSMSLAEGQYCVDNNFDPEDPRCAHVVLTGRIVKIKAGTDEEAFAQDALFSRHPSMKTWPKDHNWFFTKLDIQKICLLDYFGGVKMVRVEDYFHAGL